MRSKMLYTLAAVAAALFALGPGVSPAVAGGGAPITEEIVLDDHHIVDEGNGTLVELDTDGLLRTTTFPDGRVITSQETTTRQIVTQDGVLVSDGTSTSSLYAISRGEEVILQRLTSYGETEIGGQTCVTEFQFLYAGGQELINRLTGPTCS